MPGLASVPRAQSGQNSLVWGFGRDALPFLTTGVWLWAFLPLQAPTCLLRSG